MPSLNVLLTGNAKPLEAEMLRAQMMGEAFAKKMSRNVFGGNLTNPQSLAEGAALAQVMEKEAQAAKAMALATAAATGNGQAMRAMNKADSEAWLVKLAAAKGVSVELLKEQQAMKALGLTTAELAATTEVAAAEGFNLNGILRESLVIMREIGRGNWARVPGSLSLLAQYLGVLRFLLNPVYAGLLAVGIGLFYLNRHMKEVVEETNRMNEMFSDSKGKFEQMADAIKQNADNMREAALAARDYAAWLDKLGVKQEDLAAISDEHVKAMQDEFRLQQQVANQRGQGEQAGLRAEQAERTKELTQYEKDLSEAQKKSTDSLNAANKAEEDYENMLKTRKAKEDPIQLLVERAQKLDEIWQHMPDEEKGLMQHYRDIISGGAPGDEETIFAGNSQAPNAVVAQRKLNELSAKYFNGIEVGGQTVSASADELNYIMADEAAQAEYKQQLQKQLDAAQTTLKSALDSAKDTQDKDSTSVKELTKKRDDLKTQLDAHAKYDSQLTHGDVGPGGSRGGRLPVTERERIGAQGSQISVSLLGVAKEQLFVARETLATIKRGYAQGGVGGSHHE